jgi:hypothetical protein
VQIAKPVGLVLKGGERLIIDGDNRPFAAALPQAFDHRWVDGAFI